MPQNTLEQQNYNKDLGQVKEVSKRLYSSSRYKALPAEEQLKVKSRYYDKVLSPLVKKYPDRLGKLDKDRFMGIATPKGQSAPDDVKAERLRSAAYAVSGSFIDLAKGTTELTRNLFKTLGDSPRTDNLLANFEGSLTHLRSQNQALQDSVAEHNISRHVGEIATYALAFEATASEFPAAVGVVQNAVRTAGVAALTDLLYGKNPGQALASGAEFAGGDIGLGAITKLFSTVLSHGPKGEILEPLINEAFKDAAKNKPGQARIIIDAETKRPTINRSLLPAGYSTDSLPPIPNTELIGTGGDPSKKLLQESHVANYNFTEQDINHFKQVIEANGGEFHGVDSMFGVYYHAHYSNGTKTTLTRAPHEITPELVKKSIAQKKAIFLLQKDGLAPQSYALHPTMLPAKEALQEYIHKYAMTHYKTSFDSLGVKNQQAIASHIYNVVNDMHKSIGYQAPWGVADEIFKGIAKRTASLSATAAKVNTATDAFVKEKTGQTVSEISATNYVSHSVKVEKSPEDLLKEAYSQKLFAVAKDPGAFITTLNQLSPDGIPYHGPIYKAMKELVDKNSSVRELIASLHRWKTFPRHLQELTGAYVWGGEEELASKVPELEKVLKQSDGGFKIVDSHLLGVTKIYAKDFARMAKQLVEAYRIAPEIDYTLHRRLNIFKTDATLNFVEPGDKYVLHRLQGFSAEEEGYKYTSGNFHLIVEGPKKALNITSIGGFEEETEHLANGEFEVKSVRNKGLRKVITLKQLRPLFSAAGAVTGAISLDEIFSQNNRKRN